METVGILPDVGLIGLLILCNAFFAGAEIAVLSVSRSRIEQLAEEGRRSARALLRLKREPDRFLATVQVGVTVVGTLASAVGGVAAIERLRPVFEALGCSTDEAFPDLRGAREAFLTLRARTYAAMLGPLLAEHRDRLKATVVWNVEQGLALTPERIARAWTLRTELFHRMRRFLERYEFFLCPVSQLPPYDVAVEWPRSIAGVAMDNYLDWMKSCYYVTVTSHPAASMPAGFTPEGLPVGVQIVGRYRDDFGVLQLAHAFESATGVAKQRPPL